MDGFTKLEPGDLVIAHLINPTEKLWGVLLDLGVAGLTLRALSVDSFDDWMAQAARADEPPTLGLSTLFVPLFRLERVYRDEPVGAVESYAARFERRVGRSVAVQLGLPGVTPGDDVPPS